VIIAVGGCVVCLTVLAILACLHRKKHKQQDTFVQSEMRSARDSDTRAASNVTEYANVKAVISNTTNSDYNFTFPVARDEYDVGNVTLMSTDMSDRVLQHY